MSKLYLIPSSSVVVDPSKPLGMGGFGIVRKGKWCGSQVAVKILSDQALTERELNDFRLEARTNHAIPRHTNILAFFGIIDEPGHYALVMELMPEGSLFDFIDSRKSLAWDERRRIARDIACGMFCLHEGNVFHCDLKSPNVLLAKDATARVTAKVADFGLSRVQRNSELKDYTRARGGTVLWRAPEMLESFDPKVRNQSMLSSSNLALLTLRDAQFTRECDVYSYAVTLTELFTFKGPYGLDINRIQLDTLVQKIRAGERPKLQQLPDSIPDDLLDLVQQCWAHDPKRRPPFSRIVERFDSSASAPVYHSARDELCFTPPSHPPQSFRNKDQNTAYLNPVTASGSGQSADSTPPSSSPVSQASSGQRIDGENGDSASAASDVASLMQRSRLSPAAHFPNPTATPPPKAASTSSSESAAVIVNPTDLEKLYEMGRALDPEYGDEKKRSAAFEWYHKAAIAGHPASQGAVGSKLEKGLGVEKNAAKAVEWYQKAADQGHAVGQFNLGVCYRNGIGVAKNDTMAVEWYEKAAEQRHAEAQNMLGYCYEHGIGVGKDERKAVEWYKRAAEQGHANGQFNLGLSYQSGMGVAKDETKRVEWYEKAAKQGHARAQNGLGHCLASGIGVGKDERKAVEWYKRSAKQGYALGQFNLGVCYRNGIGVAKDETRAVEWYENAAKQGHARAQNMLGYCFKNGIGVGNDETKAVEWYKRAAEQGHALGQYHLGSCYYYGTGVAKDKTKMVEWYRKAAAQHQPNAIEALAKLGVSV
ncbi:hypothetical protein HK104_000949 [Borealophlyctis nickersoniae]|nr:hypothetical protein HK104_000949 [Borealophlyctis nickersoniae]